MNVPPKATHNVLLMSKDPAFLAKRKTLLGRKGYRTVLALSKQEAVLRVSNEQFSIAVLCQTVGPAEQGGF